MCAALLPCAAQCVCVGMQPSMATHYMTHYITQLSAGGCHYILHGCVPKRPCSGYISAHYIHLVTPASVTRDAGHGTGGRHVTCDTRCQRLEKAVTQALTQGEHRAHAAWVGCGASHVYCQLRVLEKL